jgi:alpha-D-ribose 1-methylphosphonate 5-triphosphate synthase subunit PhnH
MDTVALQGGFADAPRDAAFAFRAAMSAMARPGKIEEIAGARPPAPLSSAAGTLILTLCDPETGLYLAGACDTPEVRDWVTFHTGAPLVGPSVCQFAVGTWKALQPLSAYPVGTPEYPDRSATLIVELGELRPEGVRLTGPGIREAAYLNLPEVAAFRQNARLFPLGLDVFFTAGTRLAALPRTTSIEEDA